jgi:nucleoside-diphosphate kinase
MERTLVVLKPDAVQRQLVGEILQRFERKGFKIVALKILSVSGDLARRMYAPHEGKDFYPPLLEFIMAGPVVAMVLEGLGGIAVVRKMVGKTFGPDAEPGTIRGDFGMSKRYNVIHASDSVEAAAREIPLFFADGEILEYAMLSAVWTYATYQGKLL